MTSAAPMLEAVLSGFGISAFRNALGEPAYAVNVLDSSNGVYQAVFDAENKVWRFDGKSQQQDSVADTAPPARLGAAGVSLQPKRPLLRDWTEQLPPSSHVQLNRSVDWAITSLGPIRQWPITLQLIVHLMLADLRPTCLHWGPDRIAIYNEAYIDLITGVHPTMMGSPYRKSLPSTYNVINPIFETCERSRKTVHIPEIEVYMERKGFLEETWFDGMFIPIFSPETGRVAGIYNSGYEVTRQKLTDRRAESLDKIASGPDFRTGTVWQHMLDGLDSLERDIPMAILYRAEEQSLPTRCSLVLESCLGLAQDHPAIVQEIDLLEEGADGFVPALRQARSKGLPVVLNVQQGTFPPFLAQGVNWRGFHEPASTVVVIPLALSGKTAGYLIIGTNPRLEFGEDFQKFVQELGRLCSAVVGSSISFEEAHARQTQLYKDLTEREKFIRRVADISPAGLYNLSTEGVITWANKRYYEILGLSGKPEDDFKMAFMDAIYSEDQSKAADSFEMSCIQPNRIELRLRRQWMPPSSVTELSARTEPAWILAYSVPIQEGSRSLGTVGCVTDISYLKWAQEVHMKAAEAAQDARRLQERFIDVTSHEMRNPLSAILQCADNISGLTEPSKRSHTFTSGQTEVLDDIFDSSQTILLCAAHQKRIVDDILTASKLDSSMLSISHALTKPCDVAKEAFHMFDAELSASDISTQFTIEPSYEKLGVGAIYCDPVRLSQICINLFTNAIKFTKTSVKREIHVRVAASIVAPPVDVAGSPKWFPTHKLRAVTDEIHPHGHVFVTFAVQDTGNGISNEEMNQLFNRFAQANARTHIQLTEMMGGMIGANSQEGEGSTFAFYIKAIRPTGFDSTVPPAPRLGAAGPNATDSSRNPAQNSDLLPPSSAPECNLHVLLVEDNLVNQKVLSKQLRRLGATVHIANHGREALDFICTTRYWTANQGSGTEIDTILMDQEMPILDGLSCTREIRRLERAGFITKHLNIIAVTANARAEQIQTAFEAGSDHLVAKPFKVSELVEKMRL